MPDIPNEQFSDSDHTAAETEKLSPFKSKLAVVIILATILLMLLENVIGIKMYLTACLGAVALVLSGVLSEKEALNSIHQPTIFLFAGVLALSDAIQTTGAARRWHSSLSLSRCSSCRCSSPCTEKTPQCSTRPED